MRFCSDTSDSLPNSPTNLLLVLLLLLCLLRIPVLVHVVCVLGDAGFAGLLKICAFLRDFGEKVSEQRWRKKGGRRKK